MRSFEHSAETYQQQRHRNQRTEHPEHCDCFRFHVRPDLEHVIREKRGCESERNSTNNPKRHLTDNGDYNEVRDFVIASREFFSNVLGGCATKPEIEKARVLEKRERKP